MFITKSLLNQHLEVTKKKIEFWKETYPELAFDEFGRVKLSELSIIDEDYIQQNLFNEYNCSEEFVKCFNEYLEKNQYLLKDYCGNYRSSIPRISYISNKDFVENMVHFKKVENDKLVQIKLSKVFERVNEIWTSKNRVYTMVIEEMKALRKDGANYSESYDLRALSSEKEMLEYGNYHVTYQKFMNENNGKTAIMLSVNPLDLLTSSGGSGCHDNPTSFGTCWSLDFFKKYGEEHDEDDEYIYEIEKDGCYSSPKATLAVGKFMNRGIIYIANGNTLKPVRDFDFEFLGYKERSHVWLDPSEGVLIENVYPAKTSKRRNDWIKILNDNTPLKHMGNYRELSPFSYNDTEAIENYYDVRCRWTTVFFDYVALDYDNGEVLKLTQQRGDYNYESGDEIPETVYTCSHCGCTIPNGEEISIDGSYYCEECANDNYTKCECCGEYVENYNSTFIQDEDIYVCDTCLEARYTECSECGEYYKNTTSVEGHGDVCDDCLERYYFYCDECYDYHHNNEYVYVDHERKGMCSTCADERFSKCEKCGTDTDNDSLIDIDGKKYCLDCAKDIEEENKVEEIDLEVSVKMLMTHFKYGNMESVI